MKCKQFRPGFELGSPFTFPKTLTVTLRSECDTRSIFKGKKNLFEFNVFILFGQWFCFVLFYDISTIVDNLMPNPVYTDIFDICFVSISQQSQMIPSIAMNH